MNSTELVLLFSTHVSGIQRRQLVSARSKKDSLNNPASNEWCRIDNMSSAIGYALAGTEHWEPHMAAVDSLEADLVSSVIVRQVGREEARAGMRFPDVSKPNFVKHVINLIPDEARISEPMLECSLVVAARSLWAIRLAYTHSDGTITDLSDDYQGWAFDAPDVIEGVSVVGGRLMLNTASLHPTIRIMEALRCQLDPEIQLS